MNYKYKFLTYITIFISVTVGTVLIFTSSDLGKNSSFSPTFIPLFGSMFTSLQIAIYLFEKPKDRPVEYKVTLVAFLFGFIMALIPFASFAAYRASADATSVNSYKTYIPVLISLLTVIPFSISIKSIIFPATIDNKFDEFLVRNLFSFIFRGWGYKIQDGAIVIIKFGKQIPVVYYNQDDNIKFIKFADKTIIENNDGVNDLFSEMKETKEVIIPADEIAGRIEFLIEQYGGAVLLVEGGDLAISGIIPDNLIYVTEFRNVSSALNELARKSHE